MVEKKKIMWIGQIIWEETRDKIQLKRHPDGSVCSTKSLLLCLNTTVFSSTITDLYIILFFWPSDYTKRIFQVYRLQENRGPAFSKLLSFLHHHTGSCIGHNVQGPCKAEVIVCHHSTMKIGQSCWLLSGKNCTKLGFGSYSAFSLSVTILLSFHAQSSLCLFRCRGHFAHWV